MNNSGLNDSRLNDNESGKGRIRKVVIAGGGTSGWLAAATLAHQFRDLLDITLVESEQIGTVGVGESTVPTIRTFHRFLQIDEQEFLRTVAGTFKAASPSRTGAARAIASSIRSASPGRAPWPAPSIISGWTASAAACRRSWATSAWKPWPRAATCSGMPQQPQINYAYHFDASLYARFLRRMAEAPRAQARRRQDP